MERKTLAETNPELVKEWHPTKNGDLSPQDVSQKSNKKVWWQCQEGHEWEAPISNRNKVNGTKCPYCSNKLILTGYNDLATTHPDLAKEWHPMKNENLSPQDVSFGTNKKVWWRCKKGHEWEAIIYNRSKNSYGCPYCSGRQPIVGETDLVTTHPELAKQWHPTKNGRLTPKQVTKGSNKKVWWLGNCGHEWETKIAIRSQGYGCPYCSKKYSIVNKTDLATTHPELAKQWHPTKNGELTPKHVSKGSTRKVWWLGNCGHEWETKIAIRSQGYGCPYCSKKYSIVNKTDLATTHPELAKQWHPTKNGELTPKHVSKGSTRKVWWRCERGHEWEAIINSRRCQNSYGCPYCSGRRPIIGKTDLATTHPKLTKLWHPTKNGKLTPQDVSFGSHKKVWWQCEQGHEWESMIHNQSSQGSECSRCRKKEKVERFKKQRLKLTINEHEPSIR